MKLKKNEDQIWYIKKLEDEIKKNQNLKIN
jgi:hypothetical protein